MIILDTSVLSALMMQPADPAVVAWLDRQARESIWTTSITLRRSGSGSTPWRMARGASHDCRHFGA